MHGLTKKEIKRITKVVEKMKELEILEKAKKVAEGWGSYKRKSDGYEYLNPKKKDIDKIIYREVEVNGKKIVTAMIWYCDHPVLNIVEIDGVIEINKRNMCLLSKGWYERLTELSDAIIKTEADIIRTNWSDELR